MQRYVLAAVVFGLIAPALQAQQAAPISQCQASYTTDSIGRYMGVQIVPWTPVSNTQLNPGDLAKGIKGPGWQVAFSLSNITSQPIAARIDFLTQDGQYYISPGVLGWINGALYQTSGTLPFDIGPGSTTTIVLMSAADASGNPTSNEVDMVSRITYYAPDVTTLSQILGQATVALTNFVQNSTTGQLSSAWSSVTYPRPVCELTNNAYTNVSITPPAFQQGNPNVWNVGLAVNNSSTINTETLTVCLFSSAGVQLACNQQTLGPLGSMAWMLDAYFGAQVFSASGPYLFQGKVVVTSADKVSLFVLQNVGTSGSNAPWWSY